VGSPRPCPDCRGTGEVGVRDRQTRTWVRDENGVYDTQTCPRCGGEGEVAA
jgi:DnaJ-class molecular chaperone